MASGTFFERYCEVYHCSFQEFGESVFRQCLPPAAAGWARWLRPVSGSTFKTDFELIERVAGLTSADDVHSEVEWFRYQHPPAGLLRGTLRVRISGRRLLKLSASLLGQNHFPITAQTPRRSNFGG